MASEFSTQTDELFDYLNHNEGITQLEALRELGIMRLASRISDLKTRGVCIKKRNGHGYGKERTEGKCRPLFHKQTRTSHV